MWAEKFDDDDDDGNGDDDDDDDDVSDIGVFGNSKPQWELWIYDNSGVTNKKFNSPRNGGTMKKIDRERQVVNW